MAVTQGNTNFNDKDINEEIAKGWNSFVKMGHNAILDAVIARVNENIDKMFVESDISAIQISHSVVSPLISALGYNLGNIDIVKLVPGRNNTIIGIVSKEKEATPFILEIRPFNVSVEGVSDEVFNMLSKTGG